MKSNGMCLLMVAALSFVAGSLFADENSQRTNDPSGTWRWEYDMQGETIKDKLHLSLEEGGKLTGTLYSRLGAIEIKDGEIADDKLAFKTVMNWQGNEFTLHFSGSVKDDAIAGTVSFDTPEGEREFPWTPRRSVELEDVVGEWQFRIEGPNGVVYEPTVAISQNGDKDFKTVFTSKQGQELEVQKLRVEENALMFRVITDVDGNSMTVDFKGRPYGDKIAGMVDYDVAGDVGEAKFTGKRKKEEKKKESQDAK